MCLSKRVRRLLNGFLQIKGHFSQRHDNSRMYFSHDRKNDFRLLLWFCLLNQSFKNFHYVLLLGSRVHFQTSINRRQQRKCYTKTLTCTQMKPYYIWQSKIPLVYEQSIFHLNTSKRKSRFLNKQVVQWLEKGLILDLCVSVLQPRPRLALLSEEEK